MREYKTSALFEKNTKKLKGQELNNFLNKVEEILEIEDLDFYKNLRYDLKRYKRVRVNNSYVILFFGKNNVVYFVDYVIHDKAYKFDKTTLNKYENLKFN
jgi:mRNA-degrading endonuclease RelE of RelBE toxin-antitoxin system